MIVKQFKFEIFDSENKKSLSLKEDFKNFYIVKPLDNVKNVSKKLNMSEEELIKITGSKYLFVGQKIYFK